MGYSSEKLGNTNVIKLSKFLNRNTFSAVLVIATNSKIICPTLFVASTNRHSIQP